MGTLELLLVIVLVFALVGGLPRWPYSSGWGWGPSYVLMVVLVVILVLLLLGKVHIPR